MRLRILSVGLLVLAELLPSPTQPRLLFSESGTHSPAVNTKTMAGRGADEPSRPNPPWIGDRTKGGCPDGDWQRMTIKVNGSLSPVEQQPSRENMRYADCWFEITICNKTLKPKKFGPVENSDRDACNRLADQYMSENKGRDVCCSRLKETRNRRDRGCDGTRDADCDGVPDDEDDYPLDPNRSKAGEPEGCNPQKLCSAVNSALQYVKSALDHAGSVSEQDLKKNIADQLAPVENQMRACKYPRPLDPADLLDNFPTGYPQQIPRWLEKVQSALNSLKAQFLQSGGPCDPNRK